jgi:hypothetical protein
MLEKAVSISPEKWKTKLKLTLQKLYDKLGYVDRIMIMDDEDMENVIEI